MKTTNDYGATLEELLARRNKPRRHGRWQIAIVTCAVLLSLAGAVSLVKADEPAGKPGEVDFAEVARWGDRVVVSGEGARAGAEVLYTQALAPPADDSDQWYVTVWGSSQDAATAALVKAFERDGNLAPFIATPPADPQAQEKPRPWAHFNVYYADDPMQKWRFDAFSIPLAGPFPVVTIQPPRNGAMGGLVTASGEGGQRETRMVVIDRIEGSAAAKPADLRRRIQRSVKLWCAKLAASGFQSPKLADRSASHQAQPDELSGEGEVGFPWGPATPPTQPQVNPQWPPGGPVEDPEVATLDQIRDHCPECDDGFVLAQLSRKATIEEVKQAWSGEVIKRQLEALKKAAEEAKTKALEEAKAAAAKILADAKAAAEKLTPSVVSPATPPSGGFSLTTLLLALLGGGGGMALLLPLVTWGLKLLRGYRVSTGAQLLLTKEQWDRFIAGLEKLDKLTPPQSPAS